MEDGALRACQVQLGLTVAELVELCGKPDRIVPWSGRPETERCLLYETQSVGFDAPAGARFVAVCTGQSERFSGFLAPEAKRRVVAVFGLRDLESSGGDGTPSENAADPRTSP